MCSRNSFYKAETFRTAANHGQHRGILLVSTASLASSAQVCVCLVVPPSIGKRTRHLQKTGKFYAFLLPLKWRERRVERVQQTSLERLRPSSSHSFSLARTATARTSFCGSKGIFSFPLCIDMKKDAAARLDWTGPDRPSVCKWRMQTEGYCVVYS